MRERSGAGAFRCGSDPLPHRFIAEQSRCCDAPLQCAHDGLSPILAADLPPPLPFGFALVGIAYSPPLVNASTGYTAGKAKLLARAPAAKWKWTPFKNGARKDDLRLSHWVKEVRHLTAHQKKPCQPPATMLGGFPVFDLLALAVSGGVPPTCDWVVQEDCRPGPPNHHVPRPPIKTAASPHRRSTLAAVLTAHGV